MAPRLITALTLTFLALGVPQGPVLAACQFDQLAQLPVLPDNLRPVVGARINGTAVSFVLDSGTFWSTISGETASELKLSVYQDQPGYNIIGGVVSSSIVTVKGFAVAELASHDTVDFRVGEGDTGKAGLLGQDLLHGFDVEYDLVNRVIRLFKPRDCGHTVLAYWVKPEQPYSVVHIDLATRQQPHTVGAAFLNGAQIRVMLDLASSTSILSLQAAAHAGVTPGTPGVVSAGLTHGLGRERVPTWVAPFTSFKIGDEEIRNARLRIGDVAGLDTDLLLGADFFQSHRVYISSSQDQLYFTYNGGPVFELSTQAGGGAALR